MRDVAEQLWFARALLSGRSEDESHEGTALAAGLLAALPPSWPHTSWAREDLLPLIEPARADLDARRDLADALNNLAWMAEKSAKLQAEQRVQEKAARAARKAALDLVKQVERVGQHVSGMTLAPDGRITGLTFERPGAKAGNGACVGEIEDIMELI